MMKIKLGIIIFGIVIGLQGMQKQKDILAESLANDLRIATAGFEQQPPMHLCYVENQETKHSATLNAIKSFETSKGNIRSRNQVSQGMGA